MEPELAQLLNQNVVAQKPEDAMAPRGQDAGEETLISSSKQQGRILCGEAETALSQ